ncbi:MAG TPA: MarR family transcriptional regulator [Pseudonocardiaceae bacterium]|jgi:DNA-binding MarR family transcriptional regulator|nr:MarR family transcriptional regulator [Pseudonocardiaceae bacterium]
MVDARWLTLREQQVWRHYIAATRLVESEIDRQLQRDVGLPATYFEILVALSEAPDHTLRMSEVADQLRFSRSRLSHAVAKMEQSGWITRQECPSDKRGAFAVLTDAGLAVLADAARGHVNNVRQLLFDVLTTEQQDQLGEICALLRKANEV